MGAHLTLSIDRIRIGGLGLYKDQLAYARSQFPEIPTLAKNSVKEGNVQFTQKKYVSAITLRTKSSLPAVRLEVGISKSKHRYVTWDLWPHRISKCDMKGFLELISILFPIPQFDYAFAYAQGRVNYLELALDYIGPMMHAFLPWVERARTSNIFSKSGELGSIYIGSINSAVRFCIYDKAKQLLETGRKSILNRLVRIEARLSKLKMSPANLHQLENPFARLTLAERKDCEELQAGKYWDDFLAIATATGTAAAFQVLDKQERKCAKQMLKERRCAWWQPASALAGLQAALAALDPVAVCN